VNKAPDDGGEKFGKSCIIGSEHNIILARLITEGRKPRKSIKYMLCRLEGEMMIIADIYVWTVPPADIDVNYGGG